MYLVCGIYMFVYLISLAKDYVFLILLCTTHSCVILWRLIILGRQTRADLQLDSLSNDEKLWEAACSLVRGVRAPQEVHLCERKINRRCTYYFASVRFWSLHTMDYYVFVGNCFIMVLF